MSPAVVPAATYRLQFNKAFTFDDATGVVDYLDRLGISHCYASSYFKAVPGSTHGYDVADPTRLNPEIGDRDSYDRVGRHAARASAWGTSSTWCRTTWASPSRRTRGGRTSSRTARARDYATFFDIDWHPLKQELENKVLLPILGDSYGAVLERQEITLQYDDGAFRARYFNTVLPIAPGTYDRILGVDVGDAARGASARAMPASSSSASSRRSGIFPDATPRYRSCGPNAIAKKKSSSAASRG